MGLMKLPPSAMEMECTAVEGDRHVLLKEDFTHPVMKIVKQHFVRVVESSPAQERR
jgi:hypothetical protein